MKDYNSEMKKIFDRSFYRKKKVLITGHTGFKGSWMCAVLKELGAKVTGYALEPPAEPNLFELCRLSEKMNSVTGDIRDLEKLKEVFYAAQPDIVIHMAAQPLVYEAYQNPVDTYEINVMGTVNVLECIRHTPSVQSFVNVTTDKVYKNREWEWGYRENEELNGYDPYSNSKSCSELVTSSYINSYFKGSQTAVSTVRAGNVIGGGDFAANRIIPDCVRGAYGQKRIEVRNPNSIRPYQHVLDAIMAYLLIGQAQYRQKEYAGNYNIGPEDKDAVETGTIVTMFCQLWARWTGEILDWDAGKEKGFHEANFLKLDCSKMKQKFQWRPVWNIEQAIEKTVEWSVMYQRGEDIVKCMKNQIEEFIEEFESERFSNALQEQKWKK
jgi:CDP-glucose 4,6-dehydratase